MWEIPREIRQNRKLIGTLAKNDFKKKFAGSYLGIIWAFVQPIVTFQMPLIRARMLWWSITF